METAVRTDQVGWTGAWSGVSWASVLAGAFVSAAVSLALLALGAGLGLASVSPWSGMPSGSTFTNITGAYLLMIAIMSSAIGGYLASRLRTRWTNLHTNEVFFRDSAHGFVTWAFATVLSASLLATATTNLLGGAASGIAAGAGASVGRATNPNAVFVDKLFRTDRAPQAASGVQSAAPAATGGAPSGNDTSAAATPAPSNPSSNPRAEVVRLWTADFTNGTGLQPADRTYVARLVGQQTGMSEADAQKRVDDVVNETKEALDRARKNAMKLSFWMTAALLFGAFASSLAAVEGGQHRDGTWNGRRLVPRAF
jgi:hypothetical protein